MKNRFLGKFIGVVMVIDPDTQAEIELEVFKDPESDGIFAVEVSFLDQVNEIVCSPYNADSEIDCTQQEPQ